jgi:hypothetical protein
MAPNSKFLSRCGITMSLVATVLALRHPLTYTACGRCKRKAVAREGTE